MGIGRVSFFPQFVLVTLFVYCYLVSDFLMRFDAASLPPVCAYCIPLSVGGASIVSHIIRLGYPHLGGACCSLCGMSWLLFQIGRQMR